MSENIRKSFAHQIDDLRQSVLVMGSKAEQLMEDAMTALIERDDLLADEIIKADNEIDDLEMEIETACMRMLALQQPMAIDLRTIGGVLKIITDIERTADHATKIAKKEKILSAMPQLKPYVDLPLMADRVKEMFKLSLDAFVALDEAAARKIIAMDDEIDAFNHRIFTDLVDLMRKDSSTVTAVSHLMSVVHSLERIADHVTNICERIIFVSTGTLPKV